MRDHGLLLSRQAIQRQLRAMPCALYLVRLIHAATGQAWSGRRHWSAADLGQPATLGFLRARNRQGCDIFFQPFAGNQNAGYILVDLDEAPPAVWEGMRHNGHAPCVVLESSPGHWQAWVHVSTVPLEPALATAVGGHLARIYSGDPASIDWRHLGRLAGFTNQKPARRLPNGYAPWVRLRYAQAGVARGAGALLEQARRTRHPVLFTGSAQAFGWALPAAAPAAAEIYRAWLHRLRILQRYPQPDWSIADQWVAQELLRRGVAAATVAGILQGGSPGFPRRHADPLDYLRRTLACAFREWAATPFSPQGGPCVDAHGCAPETAAGTSS